MRIIDLAHNWSQGTHSVYQQKFKIIKRFEETFGVQVLSQKHPQRPPNGTSITLMWTQLFETLKESTKRRNKDGSNKKISVSTVRQLRSAVSQWETLELMYAQPERILCDKDNHLALQDCRATDSYESSMFFKGMSSRLGIDIKPAVALLRRHIEWMDNEFERLYNQAGSVQEKKEYCQAGLANLLLYLGWLRGGETFSTTVNGSEMVLPSEGVSQDLPPNVGSVQFRLKEETKVDRTRQADVIIAYETLSGLCIGRWLRRLFLHLGISRRSARTYAHWLFTHPNGAPWDSRYYRYTYLYPALERQRALGDPYLAKYDGSKGNELSTHFWSLHCYRRCSRTEAERTKKAPMRKATKAEIYEHARWRYKRSGEAIDVNYRDWALRERINITYFSM